MYRTLQTRIDQFIDVEQRLQIDVLMKNIGKFYRYCVNNFFHANGKDVLDLKKIEFCKQFGIHSQYANSIAREAKKQVKLFPEARKQKVSELKYKIYRLEQKTYDLNGKSYKERKNIRTQYFLDKREISVLLHQIDKIKKSGMTCGGRGLQRKDLIAFQQKRNNFVFSSHDGYASYGSHHFKFKHVRHNQFVLELEVSDGVKINIDINMDLAVRKKEKWRTMLVNALAAGNSSFRLVKHVTKKKTKLFLQVMTPMPELKHKKQGKKAGVDFNNGHLDFCITKNNEPIHFQTVNFLHNNANSNQRKNSLLSAIKTFIQQALNMGVVEIKMENLNFSRLKSEKSQIKAMNRMIHSLPYSRYEKMMEMECAKAEILLTKVNPAYTSQNVNKLSHELQEKYTTHQLAAFNIALK